MTTWNTTYNFNQGNMSFGQAMLYGAFGQLTGMMGMGGCFGGYGMGSYGMGGFGMGGSLFSMMGMGGFGGYGMYNCGFSDGYVGAQVGLAAMGALFQGIGGAIASRKENKAAANANLEAALKTLDIASLDKFNSSIKFENTTKATTLNDAIKTEARSALDTLDYKGYTTDPKTTPGEPQKPAEGGTFAPYTINVAGVSGTYNTYGEAKVAYDKAVRNYEEDSKKKTKHDELKNVYDNYQSVTSSAVTDSKVKAAVKAREDAKAEFEKAKDVVQNAYNQNKGNEIRGGAKGVDTSSIAKNQELNKTWSSFLKALKKLSNDTTSDDAEAKGQLKTACDTILAENSGFSAQMIQKAKEAQDTYLTNE